MSGRGGTWRQATAATAATATPAAAAATGASDASDALGASGASGASGRHRFARAAVRLACGGWLLLASACGAPRSERAWVPPRVVARTSQHAGGLLSDKQVEDAATSSLGQRAVAPPESLDPADCLPISVSWWLLAERPELSASALPSHTALVAGLGSERILLPAPDLGADVLLLASADDDAQDLGARLAELLPGAVLPVLAEDAVLPRDGGARFALHDAHSLASLAPGATPRPLVLLQAHRDAHSDAVSLALCLSDRSPTAAVRQAEAAGPSARLPAWRRGGAIGGPPPRPVGWPARAATGREFDGEEQPPTEVGAAEGVDYADVGATVPAARVECSVLRETLSPGSPPVAMCLSLPGAPATSLVLEVRVGLPPAGDGAAARAHARRVAAAGAERQRPAATAPGLPPRWVGLEHAVDALRRSASRRDALCHLGRETGAALAADLAFVGSDEQLAGLVGQVLATRPLASAREQTGASLGWELERAALELVARQAEQSEPDPLFEGVLLERAGEAGRYPIHLLRLAQRLDSLTRFEAQLVRENLVALDDPSAAARLRAFDWLSARGEQPPGYQPLDPLDARRDALAALPRREQP